MDIKVLGTGCANCKATIALIDQIAKVKGVGVPVIFFLAPLARKLTGRVLGVSPA